MVRKPKTSSKMPMKQNYGYCGFGYPPRYGEKDADSGMNNQFRKEHRSKRDKVVKNIEQKPNLNQEEVKEYAMP